MLFWMSKLAAVAVTTVRVIIEVEQPHDSDVPAADDQVLLNDFLLVTDALMEALALRQS